MKNLLVINEVAINGDLFGGSNLMETIENSQLEIQSIVENLYI